jgi:hypothetical protein
VGSHSHGIRLARREIPLIKVTHRHVEEFTSFPETAYQDIDLAGLAAFAIRRLQELQIPTGFENVVVTLFKLFPAKFSLEGFAEYPDAARVGRTLLQLGPKYRNWARGSVQKGYVLTEGGLAKAAKVSATLVSGRSPDAHQPKRPSAPRTMDLTKEVQALETSALYQKWKDGNLVSAESREFFDLLGAFAYTPSRALRDRAQFLENAAREVGREDLVRFLHSVRQAFANHFRG